jgi:hypothetical protein
LIATTTLPNARVGSRTETQAEIAEERMNPISQNNRRQRRRAAVIGEILPVEQALTRSEKVRPGSIRAWDGCRRTFTGDMPAGWVWLLAYCARRDRRTVPRHHIRPCRDRLCNSWRCRQAGALPHPRTHRARPGRRQGEGRQIRAQADPHLHQQKEARKRLEAGETQRSVARSYNVSQSTISRLA